LFPSLQSLQKIIGPFHQLNTSSLVKVQNIFSKEAISISFQKGVWNNHFIVSGLVKENSSVYSCKVSGTNTESEIKLKTNCHCTKWNESEHCEHTLALLCYFYRHQLQAGLTQSLTSIPLQPNENSPENATSASSMEGFLPQTWGYIYKNPGVINLNWKYKSFEDILYVLEDKTAKSLAEKMPFPEFYSVTIKLIPQSDMQEQSNHFGNKSDLYYRLAIQFQVYHSAFDNTEIEVIEKISFLGQEFIFDHSSGICYQTPASLKEFINHYNQGQILKPLKEYLLHFSHLLEQQDIKFKLKIQDQIFSLNDHIDGLLSGAQYLRYVLRPIESKEQYQIELTTDYNGSTLPLPSELSLFSLKNGITSQINSQLQLLEIIKNAIYLPEKFEFSSRIVDEELFSFEDFKKSTEDHPGINFIDNVNWTMVRPTQKSEIFKNWFTHFGHASHFLSYDAQSDQLIIWDKIVLCYLLYIKSQLLSSYFITTTEISHDEKFYKSNVPQRILFNILARFQKYVSQLKIQIFYNQSPIRTWQPQSKISRAERNIDWFNLEVSLTQEDLSLLYQIKNNERVQLINNELIYLEDQHLAFHHLIKKNLSNDELLKGASPGSTVTTQITINRTRILEVFKLHQLGFNNILTEEEISLANSLLNFKEVPNYPLDARHESILRPYQTDGFKWMRFLYEHHLGGCLADDMGLGKTLQTIALLQSINDKVSKVMIVCPVSILWNWQQEFEKFSDLAVSLYYGEDRVFDEQKKIIITSYGLLRRDFDHVFSKHKFDLLILDEVQQIKNYNSLGSMTAKKINARVRFSLTGTPVENDLVEFYNVLDLCLPGIWGEKKFSRKNAPEDRNYAKTLARPFILRRTKQQVLKELPEKIEQQIPLAFNPEEENFYKETLLSIRRNIDLNQSKTQVAEVLKSLLILRQLCLWQNHSSEIISTKLDFLVSNLSQLAEEGHSILVFSQFTTYLDHIQKAVKKINLSYSRIDGSQSITKRREQVEIFQAGETKVFLISLRAGGFGLNLTRANYIFLMDPWWNPAVENQAIDRAYRIGQERTLTVYRPIIKNSIEEKVLLLQNEKRKLFDDLMSTDSDQYYNGKLTIDDFKFLLT